MNTHYALIVFSGDPDNEHDDDRLRGCAPHVNLVGCGDEAFCWDALLRWTTKRPLQKWETAEVVARDPSVVKPARTGRAYPI